MIDGYLIIDDKFMLCKIEIRENITRYAYAPSIRNVELDLELGVQYHQYFFSFFNNQNRIFDKSYKKQTYFISNNLNNGYSFFGFFPKNLSFTENNYGDKYLSIECNIDNLEVIDSIFINENFKQFLRMKKLERILT